MERKKVLRSSQWTGNSVKTIAIIAIFIIGLQTVQPKVSRFLYNHKFISCVRDMCNSMGTGVNSVCVANESEFNAQRTWEENTSLLLGLLHLLWKCRAISFRFQYFNYPLCCMGNGIVLNLVNLSIFIDFFQIFNKFPVSPLLLFNFPVSHNFSVFLDDITEFSLISCSFYWILPFFFFAVLLNFPMDFFQIPKFFFNFFAKIFFFTNFHIFPQFFAKIFVFPVFPCKIRDNFNHSSWDNLNKSRTRRLGTDYVVHSHLRALL